MSVTEDAKVCTCGHQYVGHASGSDTPPCWHDHCACSSFTWSGDSATQGDIVPPMNFWELDPYRQHEHEAYTTNIDGTWFCKCGRPVEA